MKSLQFGLLKSYPEVIHGVFIGGMDFRSQQSREKIKDYCGFSKLIFPSLVHGVGIWRIQGEENSISADALFTSEKGIGIAVTHADCQAAFFYDPEHEVVGVIHAGWRGQVQNIYGKVCERLQREVGTDLKKLIVTISPSLGPAHAEFIHYKSEFPKSLWRFQVRPNYFNLWEMARFQWMEAGVLDAHIEIGEVCTFSGTEEYFSYRRDKTQSRHASVVGLRRC